jgi:hypothetical protein
VASRISPEFILNSSDVLISISRKAMPLLRSLAFLSSVLLPLSVFCSTAQAAGPMRPGLWEMGAQSDLLRLLPKLSAEQTRQLSDFGIQLPPSRDGALLARVCITPEMAAQEQPPMLAPNDMGCTSRNFRHQGNAYSMELVCDSEKMNGQGTLNGTFASDRQFSATLHFTGTAYGQPISQTQQTSGDWIGPDCGKVKPIAPPTSGR